MPASITLTVSNLPQSTSFFLSILQPLGYVYRGQACPSIIAFGPRDTSIPPDFWLTQATQSVPVGAAHVAFPATSRQVVQDFFSAALEAGGSIHGEPSQRDQHGYYSAAVIDFDGNSIEAVHRPVVNDGRAGYSETSTVVSKRSQSRTRSIVSRAPTALTRLPDDSGKTAISTTSLPPTKEAKSGDMLDDLLAQARSAANMAKQLVDSVRPNLSSSTSAPAVNKSAESIHNKDAFAKPGDPSSNAVVGTLLGVAAGAAMTYAFTSRSSSSSPPHDRNDNDRRSHADKRPSIARSATVPQHHTHGSHKSSHDHHRHYIDLHDNDRHSTLTTSTAKPTHDRRRRSSFDSAIGVSPPSSTSTARSSRKQKLIDAPPPPSAYRGPTGTQSPTTPRCWSKMRTEHAQDDHAATQRSRSASRSRSKHHRHDSGYAEAPKSVARSGYETMLHITTHGTRNPLSKNHQEQKEKEKEKEKERPSSKWRANKMTALPMLSNLSSNAPRQESRKDKQETGRQKSGSKSRSKVSTSTARPEAYPLPPSRAATWTAGSAERGDGQDSSVSARSRVSRGGGGGGGGHESRGEDSNARGGRETTINSRAKTVIGKMRDVRNLRVRAGEVRPEDSVSQVG